MDTKKARETLNQLARFTRAACKLLGVPMAARKRNHSGRYIEGQPEGIICHYTASNAALHPRRPYGRLPVMLNRLRPMSGQGVGCHVVVWDQPIPRLDQLKERYPLLQDIPAEVFFFGDDRALWHAGAANRWSIGIEVRNCGEVQPSSRGMLYWGQGRYRYRGRKPVEIGSKLWEPYTYSQMLGTLWVSRLLAQVHPIVPHKFLGHTHVSSTRIDPGPHFPLHEMREAIFFTPETPLYKVPFLGEFLSCREKGAEQGGYDDPMVSEDSLHQGMYRHDWDGEFTLSDVIVEPLFDADDWKSDLANPEMVTQLKKNLRLFGYYPGEKDDGEVTREFAQTIWLFRSRWKKRVIRGGRRRWVQAVPINSRVDDTLLELVERFDRQQYRMVG